MIGPRGWKAGQLATRFAGAQPKSYDRDGRTIDAVIATDTPVKRAYGVEVLRIASDAVDLSRIQSSGVPLLDSHDAFKLSSAIGRVENVWFEQKNLVGRIAFNDTDEGRKAEGMVARGEITGISAGYRVDQWTVTDDDGDEVDPSRVRWDDDQTLTYTASKWVLLECSLVSVPADHRATIRSHNGRSNENELALIKARMQARQAIVEQMGGRSTHHDEGVRFYFGNGPMARVYARRRMARRTP
jgi:phage head maturation protease